MAEKFEREIDELLRKLEEDEGGRAGHRQRRARPWDGWTARFTRMRPASPGQLMLSSIGLLLVAVLLGFAGVFRAFARPVAMVAVLLFAVAYVTSFMRPPFRRGQHWRGKEMEIDTRLLPWWQKVYLWLYG